MSASMNVAGGRGLPIPLAPVRHEVRAKVSYRPPGWDRLPAVPPPPAPAPPPRPRRATTTRTARTPGTGRPPTVLTRAQLQQARVDYEARAASLDQLARRHRVDWKRMRDLLEADGVTIRPQGGAHHRGELTPEQLREAVVRYEAGVSAAKLGPAYGIHRERMVVLLRESGVVIRVKGKRS